MIFLSSTRPSLVITSRLPLCHVFLSLVARLLVSSPSRHGNTSHVNTFSQTRLVWCFSSDQSHLVNSFVMSCLVRSLHIMFVLFSSRLSSYLILGMECPDLVSNIFIITSQNFSVSSLLLRPVLFTPSTSRHFWHIGCQKTPSRRLKPSRHTTKKHAWVHRQRVRCV